MNMCPNLISLFHRILFYVVGDVCLYSAVSRWVTCYVVASPLCHVVIGSLVDYSFFFNFFLFGLEITLYCLCIMMRLFTLDGCGDYRQVHPKTLFEIAMVLSTKIGSFPSNSHVSATFSILLRFGESWVPTNCEKFNADGSLIGKDES